MAGNYRLRRWGTEAQGTHCREGEAGHSRKRSGSGWRGIWNPVMIKNLSILALKLFKDTMTNHDLRLSSSLAMVIKNDIESLRAPILRESVISIDQHLF